MIKIFYNKEIEIYNKGKFKDEFGITHNSGYKLADTLMVDVQPYSSEKLKKDYGYDLECTKRIFTDLNENIKESSIIKYLNEFFDIKKIVEWDDYLDIAVIEHKGSVEIV